MSVMPVFTLKAKDALIIPTLMTYWEECREHGLFEQAHQTMRALDEIRVWQQENIDLTKLPDHTHVPGGGAS